MLKVSYQSMVPIHPPVEHTLCSLCFRKAASTKVERMSLTQAEVNEAANGTAPYADAVSFSTKTQSSQGALFCKVITIQ